MLQQSQQNVLMCTPSKRPATQTRIMTSSSRSCSSLCPLWSWALHLVYGSTPNQSSILFLETCLWSLFYGHGWDENSSIIAYSVLVRWMLSHWSYATLYLWTSKCALFPGPHELRHIRWILSLHDSWYQIIAVMFVLCVRAWTVQ